LKEECANVEFGNPISLGHAPFVDGCEHLEKNRRFISRFTVII